MPIYRLAPGLLEDLIATLHSLDMELGAESAHLEQMDQKTKLVQGALGHNRKAHGLTRQARLQARDLRALLRAANTTNPTGARRPTLVEDVS